MSFYDSYPRLAGLDAMFIHFDDVSVDLLPAIPTAASMQDSMYVTCQTKPGKIPATGRAVRAPLTDRTAELNLESLSIISLPKSLASISGEGLPDPTPTSKTRPRRRSTAAFTPLPPVVSASSLKLAPFHDFSISPVQPTPPHSRRATATTSALQVPVSQPAQGRTDHTNRLSCTSRYCIPSLQHPNSPYVPWSTPIRRDILRPLTPEPQPTTSGGNIPRAPELGDGGPIPTHHGKKLRRNWRNLRLAVKKNVKSVTRRILSPLNAISCTFSTKATDVISTGCMDEKTPIPSNLPQHPFNPYPHALRSPSAISLESTATDTLATWLCARQQALLAAEENSDRLMSLEQYELMGSWIDSPRNRFASPTLGKTDGGDMLLRRLPLNPSSLVRHSPAAEELAGSRWQSPHSSPPFAGIPDYFKPSSPRTTRYSQWFDSLDQVAKTPRSELSDTAGGIGRKESMPGGWTFDL